MLSNIQNIRLRTMENIILSESELYFILGYLKLNSFRLRLFQTEKLFYMSSRLLTLPQTLLYVDRLEKFIPDACVISSLSKDNVFSLATYENFKERKGVNINKTKTIPFPNVFKMFELKRISCLYNEFHEKRVSLLHRCRTTVLDLLNIYIVNDVVNIVMEYSSYFEAERFYYTCFKITTTVNEEFFDVNTVT